MTAYYLLILVPILVSLVQNRRQLRIGGDTREDEPRGALSAFFLIFLGLLMCRGMSVGADMPSYRYYFEKIGRYSWRAMLAYREMEPGYVMLNWLVAQLTKNYHHFVAVVSGAAVLPIAWFYKRTAEKPVLTVLLFACVAPVSMYFSGLRQILAMAFSYPLWYCARERKPLRFLLLVLLAMSFHKTAFVLLVLYPLYSLRITPAWLLLLMPALAAVYAFKRPLLLGLIRLFWEKETRLVETGATTVLILLILFAVYAYVIPDERKMDKDTAAMRNVLLLSVAIQCMAPIHQTVMRMNYYFLPFIPLLIPRIAGRSKRNYYGLANLSVAVMTGFFLFYFFWHCYTDADILCIYPYVPVWGRWVW